MKIKGLKKVAGATKVIESGYKGYIAYDKEQKSVRFSGTWRDCVSVQVGKSDSEKIYWICGPVTMRQIKMMIAEDFDYDTYIEMCLEDDGVFVRC